MNVRLTTFANYSGNSKLAETSKTLKYGDLEIRLINDEYYFVHDNGATIDNIGLIKMIGSSFKGLMSTFPQSITSDLINYAPTMSLFINAMSEYVKKSQLQDGTFDLIVSSATVDGFVSCISLSTTTSASIGSSLTCSSLTVSNNANIYGLLNGCNIATNSLSSLGTLPLIPVIKSDSIMEIGRFLDFHYNASVDNNTRIECESDGAIRITNNGGSNHPLRLTSTNSSSCQIQFGKRTGYSNECAIIQYNLTGQTLGFGFWNNNNKMTLDPSGNLSTSGTITSPTITSINTAIDGKADVNHNHDTSYSALNHNHDNSYSALNHNHDNSYSAINHNHDNSYSALNHTHSSNDITDLENEINSRFRLLIANLIYPVGIIICLYQPMETLGATVWTRNPLVYIWNFMLWEFLPDDVFIRNGFKNSDNEEDGATMTPAGSDTHTHTTQSHSLTENEMPSHNHAVFGAHTTNIEGNNQDCLTMGRFGSWAAYEILPQYHESQNPSPYISSTGGNQPHNHGDTGSASNVPKHIVAYFYRRIE